MESGRLYYTASFEPLIPGITKAQGVVAAVPRRPPRVHHHDPVTVGALAAHFPLPRLVRQARLVRNVTPWRHDHDMDAPADLVSAEVDGLPAPAFRPRPPRTASQTARRG